MATKDNPSNIWAVPWLRINNAMIIALFTQFVHGKGGRMNRVCRSWSCRAQATQSAGNTVPVAFRCTILTAKASRAVGAANVQSIHRTTEIRALSCKPASECSIGSSWQDQTFAVVDLNDRLWSAAAVKAERRLLGMENRALSVRDGSAFPITQIWQQRHGSGTSNENSDRHHARFSAVCVALLPKPPRDGFEIIETARGSLESHPNCSCRSSHEIASFSSLISHRNVACICSVAAEMPSSP